MYMRAYQQPAGRGPCTDAEGGEPRLESGHCPSEETGFGAGTSPAYCHSCCLVPCWPQGGPQNTLPPDSATIGSGDRWPGGTAWIVEWSAGGRGAACGAVWGISGVREPPCLQGCQTPARGSRPG